MKGYKQPVRIHKNSLKIKETLEDIGYEFQDYDPKASFIETYMNGLAAHDKHDIYTQHMVIDCGEDEELFFLLAAMTDDNDYLQLFVWRSPDKTKWNDNWWICDCYDLKTEQDYRRHDYFGAWFYQQRKASIEEIKEYSQIKNNKSNG